MARRGSLAIADCDRCKASTPQSVRQVLGCGYEPPIDRVRLQVWQPPSGKHGYSGPALTTCAGYTVNLPEVHEASAAYAHWNKGNASVLGPLSEMMLDAILTIAGQYAQLQAWNMTPASEGGGGS